MNVLGRDHLNIAGHRVPIGALVVAAGGLVGVLLLLQARNQGGGASVGAAPVDTLGSSSTVGSNSDVLSAFGQLEGEIGSLQGEIATLQSANLAGSGAVPGSGGTDSAGGLPVPSPFAFWRDIINGAIYEVNSQGQKRYLGTADWAVVEAGYSGNAPYTNVDPSQLFGLPDVAGFIAGPDPYKPPPLNRGIAPGIAPEPARHQLPAAPNAAIPSR